MVKQTKRRTLIYCDEIDCGKAFSMSDVTIKQESLKDRKVGYFFRCPFCKAKYSFASLTKKGQKILSELQEVRKRLGTVLPSNEKYPFLVSRYTSLLEDYQKEVGGPYSLEEVE